MAVISRTLSVICVISLIAVSCSAQEKRLNLAGCPKNQEVHTDSNSKQKDSASVSVDDILQKLNEKTKQLKSYEGKIEYMVKQPLFDSQTLRKGILYYQKYPDNSENLRINFQTLKQDTEKESQYVEQYMFDGVWLTHLDYPNKQAKMYQQAEEGKPVGCFEMASKDFPIIGFSRVEDLKRDFEITLAEQNDVCIKLNLKTKPDGGYKGKYKSIDFWIDKSLFMPCMIEAESTEEDIYEIRLIEPKLNKEIKKSTFEFKIPKEFGPLEKVPLKQDNG